ncbi:MULTISPECIES: ABC transporter ATP-binding protein [Rhodomicrobium]|uniref:ABC transporter ATP-binding protein n=1 Tax=Rhodomicrobium TaxID=1068 RepID=UPI000B4AE917|nr:MULTISPECIES: ABC transporter ATP-binding protein [Rhodomicrobium]
MTGIAITVEACGKTFADGTRALSPISFEIGAGESIAILGPSGCGKTTALRIIAGLEGPDPGGRVLFDGADVTPLPIERRNVGMVFQSYALFPNMSVIENVAYGLRVRGVPRQPRLGQAQEVLAMMRLAEFGGRRIDQLSGGQRQRVALARALAVKPRVLLLDEPLTALDAALREDLRAEIDGLLRTLRISSVYVTHDQAEAMVLGDRIIVMERGAIAQIGTPRDIYFRPASRFVASFVGTMNRLEGAIRGGVFETRAGRLPVDRADAAEAVAFFRPEAARLTPADGAPLRFRVARCHFLGAAQRVYLDAGEGAPALIADTDNRRTWQPGQETGLAVSASDLLFL